MHASRFSPGDERGEYLKLGDRDGGRARGRDLLPLTGAFTAVAPAGRVTSY